MSFANQPSRLLISSDDLDYGQGNSFTCTLPEPITGAVKADLLRAVIPNTGYPIPAYQSKFYYYLSTAPTTLLTATLNVNQYFDSIAGGSYPLLTALNAMTSTLVFSYNANTNRITVAPTTVGVTIQVAPSSAWPTQFALNTRLGFQNVGSTGLAVSQTGTIMPNLIRSKVVYVLCNVVMNDSISTDGLRTAIAKCPVNSTYGGLTIYVPPVLNWNRLVTGQSYQQVKIDLLDDQYQPYPLSTEEFCEFEIGFKYDDIEDARMLR